MSWVVDVDFRSSGVHGTGVFARRRIPAGARIWEVDDTMRFSDQRSLAALPPTTQTYALHGGYLHRPADRLVWYEDGMQFMNHAPGPRANVGLDHWPSLAKDHTTALRQIEAGEELFEDYGFWAESGLTSDHWLASFYLNGCPHHLAFLQSIAPRELVDA